MNEQLSLFDEIRTIKSHLAIQDHQPIHRLKDCLNSQTPIEEFKEFQTLVSRISNGFIELGWPPLRVHASYFSQSGQKNSHFEVSWLRNDLLASVGKSSRTTTSHGPAFRFVMTCEGNPSIQMQSRHNLEARSIFIKNVLNPVSSRWIDHCLKNLIRDDVNVKWSGEWVQIEAIEQLQQLALSTSKSKEFQAMKFSYFSAAKLLRPVHLRDNLGLLSVIVGFFAKTAPLFWAHNLMLAPRSASSQKQIKGQISREQLRRNVLKLEHRCQNADCPLDKGDPRKLKVAHLTPKIHLLSNVIVLCSICYDEQFPATSVIKVLHRGKSLDENRLLYSVEILTRDGPRNWWIDSHLEHSLSNPRIR